MEPITVITERCIGCGLCVKSCAYDAITLAGPPGARPKSPTAVVDLEKCTLCGACTEASSRYGAIVMKGREAARRAGLRGDLRVRRTPQRKARLGRA